MNAIVFGKILARIIIYEDFLMSQFLRYPEVRFVRVPEYLDSYIASFNTHTRERVRNDYMFLNSFCFIPNNDTLRSNAFLKFLNDDRSPG